MLLYGGQFSRNRVNKRGQFLGLNDKIRKVLEGCNELGGERADCRDSSQKYDAQ